MASEHFRTPCRTVAVIIYRDCQHLDVAGPLEVFARTSRWLMDKRLRSEPAYEVLVTAVEAGPVRMSSGLELLVHSSIDQLADVDTLLVAGGIGCHDAMADQGLIEQVRQRAGQTRRLGSICSGALILAQAGLLRGREVTTHWAYCSRLAQVEPSCAVKSDALYVKSQGIYTSAGVTAGIDLALSMVEEDHGKATAVSVAQELVVYRRRKGGQDQFSRFLEAEKRDDWFGHLHMWILDNLDRDLTVEQLAGQARMSPRHFSRVFKNEIGMTPAQFVAKVRIEEARRQLESAPRSLKSVAARCGFGSEQSFRRTFNRALGISPVEYRARFGS